MQLAVFCRRPCNPPSPQKNHFHPSHKKSLLKNKVLPSFLYNSGKQSRALYAGAVHLDSDTSFAESTLLNLRVKSRKWLSQEVVLKTQTWKAISLKTSRLWQQLQQTGHLTISFGIECYTTVLLIPGQDSEAKMLPKFVPSTLWQRWQSSCATVPARLSDLQHGIAPPPPPVLPPCLASCRGWGRSPYGSTKSPQNRGWKEWCFEEVKFESYTHKSLRLLIELKRKQRNLKTWDSGKLLHISHLQSTQNRAKTGEEVQLLTCQGSKRLKRH